ncbi:MAG TPA: hypothetical protein PK082_11025 [Phycisphaerae bacterium]|nr:hypothetical protein [Phycisphaerae bacterium]
MKALRNDRTLTRLVGRVLCLIGLHRWRWLDCPWELIKRGCFARRVCTRCHRHFVRKSRCWTETINPASMTANNSSSLGA